MKIAIIVGVIVAALAGFIISINMVMTPSSATATSTSPRSRYYTVTAYSGGVQIGRWEHVERSLTDSDWTYLRLTNGARVQLVNVTQVWESDK